jgi:hypothetical protein
MVVGNPDATVMLPSHHPIFLLPSPQQSIVLNKTSRITPHLPPNLEISLSVFAPGSVPKGI